MHLIIEVSALTPRSTEECAAYVRNAGYAKADGSSSSLMPYEFICCVSAGRSSQTHSIPTRSSKNAGLNIYLPSYPCSILI